MILFQRPYYTTMLRTYYGCLAEGGIKLVWIILVHREYYSLKF